jgi:hypothetical protein
MRVAHVTPRSALLLLIVASGLSFGGLAAAIPALAVVGGALFVPVGVCLAYDVSGIGARWISFQRSLGAPTLGISTWLQHTIDGAAITCLGIALAWVGALAIT